MSTKETRPLTEKVALALQYSRNYVAAAIPLATTPKEHIEGLCDLVEELVSALASQPAEQPRGETNPSDGYYFRRFVGGKRRAEDVEVMRAKTLDEAMATAARICPHDHEPTVLVLSTQPKAARDAQVVEDVTNAVYYTWKKAIDLVANYRKSPEWDKDLCLSIEHDMLQKAVEAANPAPSQAVVDIEDDRVLALRELSYVSGMQLGWQLCEAGNQEEFERIVERRAIPAVGELKRSASQAVGAVFDFVAHLQRQRDWSCRTFGPGSRAQGVIDHIRKELKEIEADPDDLKEWIDVVILALDGAWRSGAQPQEILDALIAKQTKNEGRVWPDWRTADPNKAIEHDRSHDEQPVATAGDGVTVVRYDDALRILQTAYMEGLKGCGYNKAAEELHDAALTSPSAPRAGVPEGWVHALDAAVSAIYFDDSSDYLTALWQVVKHLKPDMVDLLESDESAAYEKVKTLLAAAPEVDREA